MPAPDQVLIGSMDSLYCIFISLAVWLKFNIGLGGVSQLTPYLFGIKDNIEVPSSGGDKLKEEIQDKFQEDIFPQLQEWCRTSFPRRQGSR